MKKVKKGENKRGKRESELKQRKRPYNPQPDPVSLSPLVFDNSAKLPSSSHQILTQPNPLNPSWPRSRPFLCSLPSSIAPRPHVRPAPSQSSRLHLTSARLKPRLKPRSWVTFHRRKVATPAAKGLLWFGPSSLLSLGNQPHFNQPDSPVDRKLLSF